MITSGKLSEHVKVDVALEPVSLATTNDTGAYHSMAGYKKALFAFKAAAMADTKTVVAQVMKAQDAAATGAAALTGATATITANTKSTKALLTANTVADGTTTVKITATMNDGSTSVKTYICEDTTPDISAGEFASGANDAAAMVNLAAAIAYNQGDYILATAGASPDVVTLTAAKPGEAVITLEDADSTIVPSTLEAIGYVEVDAAQLGSTFTHVALKLTTDATIVVGGTLVRGSADSGQAQPSQAVAASTVL